MVVSTRPARDRNNNQAIIASGELAHVSRFLIAGLLPLAAAIPLGAREMESFDFSLRFPAALTRFASYADVAAMGNAQAASEWSTSNNPASAAWPHTGRKYLRAVSPQVTALRFDAGTNLYVTSEALTLDAGRYGVFIPAAAQISSNHKQDRTGVGFEFSGDLLQLQWGQMLAADTAVGVNFNATFSDTRQDIPGLFAAHSRGKSYNLRVGGLRKIHPTVRVGVMIDYTVAPARTNVSSFDPVSASFQTARFDDTTDQFLFRTGLTWEYSKGSVFSFDYQGGTFANDSGRLKVHRFPIGIEHLVIKDVLFVRAGATFDTRGEVAFTSGFGLSVSDRASVDVAYQHDMFPETRLEFGSSASYTLSLSVSF